MGLLGLWGFVVFILCFLVLAYVPLQTHASSRSSINRKNLVVEPLVKGLCASMVIGHGYKCQELEVTTKDGYILSLQRIPEGRRESGGIGTKKQSVIIQHGVMVDGMIWFMNSPEQNLPMILADSGFDVWIVNSRGTRYSRRHTFLDPSNDEFWNWCLDDLVAYDLPAVFDFVYNLTGQKIHYVGHSLGTLMALTSFSERQLVHQVKSAALLSPVAFLSHMKTALGVIAARSLLSEALTLLRVAEFDPRGLLVKGYVRSVCASPGVDCSDMMSAMTGPNCCLNSSAVDQLLLHDNLQPTSTKNMVHLAQIVRYGVLAKYNHLEPQNMMKIPENIFPQSYYNLSNIPHDLPLFLSYGGQDALSDVADVQNLIDRLKSHDVDKLNVQYIKDYAHADHIMALNAKDIVYNAIVTFFKHQ
ncbi:unnamed protein product [Lupinus luteus]|uniref:Lipase n=1 Tax=Lupinus luteus TaxID=3873 RepID=A0AAV1VQC2_LUPLU